MITTHLISSSKMLVKCAKQRACVHGGCSLRHGAAAWVHGVCSLGAWVLQTVCMRLQPGCMGCSLGAWVQPACTERTCVRGTAIWVHRVAALDSLGCSPDIESRPDYVYNGDGAAHYGHAHYGPARYGTCYGACVSTSTPSMRLRKVLTPGSLSTFPDRSSPTRRKASSTCHVGVQTGPRVRLQAVPRAGLQAVPRAGLQEAGSRVGLQEAGPHVGLQGCATRGCRVRA